MNITQSINFGGTQSIKQLAPRHSVYLVDLGAGKCVIKQDLINSNRHAMNPASIMNAIDPSAHSRTLGKQELMQLRDWATGNKAFMEVEDHTYFMKIVNDALKPPTVPRPGMPGQSQQSGAWTVMQAKGNLHDLESAAEKRLAGNKAGVKAITEKLRAPGGLEKIGEIVAVDAFNSYGDRVDFDGNGGKKVDGFDTRCKCLWNPGNFFVDGNEGVLGLDAIDPNTEFNNWERMPDIPTGSIYSGTFLRRDNAQARMNLCRMIHEDFELLLGPRNRRGVYKVVGAKHRLPKDSTQRLCRGMESGAQKILAHLQKRFINGQIPMGLKQRLDKIGWLTRRNFPRI